MDLSGKTVIPALIDAHQHIGLTNVKDGPHSKDNYTWTTHTELRDMAGCGLTPMEVIEAATRVNAEILGLDDLGTVAARKSASFVVLDANPLDDIRNTRRVPRR